MRIDSNRTTKRLFDSRSEGRRGIERPKLRWRGNVDQDIRLLERGIGSAGMGKSGRTFPRRSGPTEGCRANNYDVNDDDHHSCTKIYILVRRTIFIFRPSQIHVYILTYTVHIYNGPRVSISHSL
jgi:hypothetical protein